MVNARECDRCGEIYGEQEAMIFHPLEIWQNKEKRDLCSDCEREFDNFYNYEYEKIKDVEKIIKEAKKDSKKK